MKKNYFKKINLQNYKNQFNFEQLSPGEKALEILLDNKLFFRKNFTVLGKLREPIHITNLCKIKTSDSKYNISNLINLSSNNYFSFCRNNIK